MKYEFLLPCSPDFNPIEPAFLAIKAHICCNGGIFQAARVSLHDTIWSVTPEDAWG